MKTKKPYISPDLESVKIHMCQLLASSPMPKDISYGGSNADAPTVAESQSFFGSLEEESEDSY